MNLKTKTIESSDGNEEWSTDRESVCLHTIEQLEYYLQIVRPATMLPEFMLCV